MRFFFHVRVIQQCNSSSECSVKQPALSSFKRELDEGLEDYCMQCCSLSSVLFFFNSSYLLQFNKTLCWKEQRERKSTLHLPTTTESPTCATALDFYSHFLPFESLAKCLKDMQCYNNVPFSTVTSIIKDTALSIYNHTKKKLNHASIFNTEDYKILKNLGNDPSLTVSRPDRTKDGRHHSQPYGLHHKNKPHSSRYNQISKV